MSLMSDQKLLSGRSALVGQGVPKATEGVLNPASFAGALVQGTDKLMHYSDGERWIGLAPVLSTIFDAGNADTKYTGRAAIDLGGA